MGNIHTDIYPSQADSNPGFDRVESIITPSQVVSDFLFGIPLKDRSGNQMPLTVVERHWRGAISKIEHDLDVTITPTTFVDNHDYRAEDYNSWFFIKLKHKPISPNAEDVSIQMQYIRDQTLVDLPKAWYRIYPESGQIQMTPTSGTMGQFFLSQVGIVLPGILGTKKDYPQLIKITYKAGFEQDRVPSTINSLIGYMTAVDILEIMSDIILGMPGLNSYGIGLDGMSQSVTKEGFMQRINLYNEKIIMLTDTLLKYYKAFTFTTL